MAEIIDLNNKQTIDKEDVARFKEILNDIIDEGNADGSLLHGIVAILDMKETDFSILAPGIIQSFQQSINNPNDKILLVQALGASGTSSDDLIENFNKITEELDNITTLSTQKKDFLKTIFASILNAIMDTEGISKRYVQIPIELCHKDAKIPQYANISDSGMDVYALDDYTINPGETKLIPTGIKLAIPPGYEIQVRPKSGRALKTKIRIPNTPGTIDAGYRDEIGIIVENIEPPFKDITYHFDDNGKIVIDSILHGAPYTIGKGEKFCQLVLSEVPKAALYRVESVGEIGENRGGGFGSTGLK